MFFGVGHEDLFMGKSLNPEHRDIPRCPPRPSPDHHTIAIKVWRLSENIPAAIFIVRLIGALCYQQNARAASLPLLRERALRACFAGSHLSPSFLARHRLTLIA